jgi:hypothetical protein
MFKANSTQIPVTGGHLKTSSTTINSSAVAVRHNDHLRSGTLQYVIVARAPSNAILRA